MNRFATGVGAKSGISLVRFWLITSREIISMIRCATVFALLICQPNSAPRADDHSVQGRDFDPAAAEAVALARADGKAERRDNKLMLRLENGRSTTLTSDYKCPPMQISHSNCVQYRLVRILRHQNAFLVYAGYYEGGDYRWIDDRSGQATTLPETPIFGSDPKHFLTISNSEAYNPSGIWLWEIKDDQPIQVWSHKKPTDPLYCTTDFVSRRTSSKIVLDFACLTRAQPPEVTVLAVLVRKKSDWKLEVA